MMTDYNHGSSFLSEEVKADLRNRLQAPLTILTALKEGKKIPEALLNIGIQDIERLKKFLDECG